MTDHTAGRCGSTPRSPSAAWPVRAPHAAKLIADGLVTVDGKPVSSLRQGVATPSCSRSPATDHYVSRGAHKLIAALDAFEVPVAGRTVLDAGASTGGFSQVLLERGAAQVIAVDVGHGQLAPELAARAAARPWSRASTCAT